MTDVIQRDPDILSGTPTFKATRVPIKNLFDYLSAGSSIDEFLDDFPSVSKEQVLVLLNELKDKATKNRDAA
jgi:uncharacterized protein (DUF433 family)